MPESRSGKATEIYQRLLRSCPKSHVFKPCRKRLVHRASEETGFLLEMLYEQCRLWFQEWEGQFEGVDTSDSPPGTNSYGTVPYFYSSSKRRGRDYFLIIE